MYVVTTADVAEASVIGGGQCAALTPLLSDKLHDQLRIMKSIKQLAGTQVSKTQ